MALTALQREICRLIARNRIEQGEAYVAGGVALNELTGAHRISRDIDLFHDTQEALQATWAADRELLCARRWEVRVLRERPSFVECSVGRDDAWVLMQWVCDSAFRFFPLVEHDELGLTLHPFDLATNKTLALVGRLEVRDWVDVIHCSDRVQHLGCLAWAASGKDPGFGPKMILSEAGRAHRYTQGEIAELAFEGAPPDVVELSQKWHSLLSEACAIIDLLPPEHVGTCVLAEDGGLFTGEPRELRDALDRGGLRFHPGRIRGAYPSVKA